MFHVILYQPEIPPNTGNIIRLCANTGCELHLIHPLGFVWDDKRLQRAGLDYHEFANIHHHQSLDDCLSQLNNSRLFVLTSKGNTCYSDITIEPTDAFLFGSETSGLPQSVMERFPTQNLLVIPQKPKARTLNLSNAVAVTVYEAWRQLNYCV